MESGHCFCVWLYIDSIGFEDTGIYNNNENDNTINTFIKSKEFSDILREIIYEETKHIRDEIGNLKNEMKLLKANNNSYLHNNERIIVNCISMYIRTPIIRNPLCHRYFSTNEISFLLIKANKILFG